MYIYVYYMYVLPDISIWRPIHWPLFVLGLISNDKDWPLPLKFKKRLALP